MVFLPTFLTLLNSCSWWYLDPWNSLLGFMIEGKKTSYSINSRPLCWGQEYLICIDLCLLLWNLLSLMSGPLWPFGDFVCASVSKICSLSHIMLCGLFFFWCQVLFGQPALSAPLYPHVSWTNFSSGMCEIGSMHSGQGAEINEGLLLVVHVSSGLCLGMKATSSNVLECLSTRVFLRFHYWDPMLRDRKDKNLFLFFPHSSRARLGGLFLFPCGKGISCVYLEFSLLIINLLAMLARLAFATLLRV